MKKPDPVIISAQDYYGTCPILNIFFEKKDGDEYFYNWSDHLRGLSKGFVYQVKCQPGLILAITRQSPSTAISISRGEEIDCVSLGFGLRDGSHIQHHIQEQETSFCLNQGGVSYGHNLKSKLIHLPERPFCFIGVLMEPWFIKRFSQGIAGDFAQKIEEMLAPQNEGEFFYYPVFMTPSIHVCIHEILGCTYIDARRPLFLGSKALELMTLGFDQLNSDKGQDISCFNLETGSRNFVHKARDIMISDIKNPPSLTELSRMVGVNRNRLNQCFRKVYGVTIFDFLRTFRLEESKRLLQAGNRSVTDVAFEVGYAQHGTFSREFKKYFGDTPSAYLG
ncbi:AraC family transcriptional regulator [uncultured Desulfobacter sp.]|uniref:helix-turn-helix transcriptional regulator n=1 Tax=uncultured Desulfobacter sp. TaxID=240139 RepID=UPI002AA6579E|nr:AraC family transcriptional regulator [uncultured Desulfobacter sp.]